MTNVNEVTKIGVLKKYLDEYLKTPMEDLVMVEYPHKSNTIGETFTIPNTNLKMVLDNSVTIPVSIPSYLHIDSYAKVIAKAVSRKMLSEFKNMTDFTYFCSPELMLPSVVGKDSAETFKSHGINFRYMEAVEQGLARLDFIYGSVEEPIMLYKNNMNFDWLSNKD